MTGPPTEYFVSMVLNAINMKSVGINDLYVIGFQSLISVKIKVQ